MFILKRSFAPILLLAVMAGCARDDAAERVTEGGSSAADAVAPSSDMGGVNGDSPISVVPSSDQYDPKVSSGLSALNEGLNGYRWDPRDPGIAVDEADAAWLNSVGYPDSSVYKSLMSLSPSALNDLAAGGNRTAAVLHAYKLAQQSPGDPRVFEILMDQARLGNVYAIKTMADISMVLKGYKDPVMASVYYGMLGRAGDHSGYGMKYLVDQSIGMESVFKARIMEDELWRTFNGVYEVGVVRRRPGYEQVVDGALSKK